MGEDGDLDELEEYDGERDYKTLSEFAKQNLKPSCSVSHMELCDDDTQNQIKELQKMSIDDLIKTIDEVDENVEKIEDGIDERLIALEDDIEEMINTLDQDIDFIKKKLNYKHMEGVLAL